MDETKPLNDPDFLQFQLNRLVSTNQDLLERISKLETLVDSLCVGACGWKDNPSLYTVIKNKALYRGQVVLREAEARNRLKELQQEQAILLEDYPSLRDQVAHD